MNRSSLPEAATILFGAYKYRNQHANTQPSKILALNTAEQQNALLLF